MKLEQVVAILDNPILAAFGLSPREIIASLVFAAIVAAIPEIVAQIRELIAQIKKSPNPFDNAAIPVLEAIAGKLEDGARDDAGMHDISKLIASAAWAGAKDPKEARAMVKQLSRDLVRKGLEEIERQAAKQASAIGPQLSTSAPFDAKVDENVNPGL